MEIESIIVGVCGAVISISGMLKLKGYSVLDKEKAEIYADLKEAVGNIDLAEMTSILSTAQLYAAGGYTDAELLDLGKKIVKAAQNGETCLAEKGN